ncbi:hypothetical protein CU098_013272 [Rhizopus stolonifer]|uniref:Uncharacterized protein n=1 Tax=Rhizopus stolonifer TaxID=4846 RepID=A0A367KX14_RHIST|nr:hypothetical protein CU098_013272 [Rhizopus stolonifer]
MLYYVEYPPENAIKYKNIPEFQNYKICFNTNGYEPIQVMKQRKLGNPLTYLTKHYLRLLVGVRATD